MGVTMKDTIKTEVDMCVIDRMKSVKVDLIREMDSLQEKVESKIPAIPQNIDRSQIEAKRQGG